MDLRTRLELYKAGRSGDHGAAGPAKAAKGPDVQELIKEGNVCSGEMGSCFVIENKFSSNYIHGGCRLGDALRIKPGTLRKLNTELPGDISVSDFLFLDTETSGLSGGAGTVAFLIGTGFFADDVFIVRQYFMRDYNEEIPMLWEFNRVLGDFRGFVTFNGKSFDWNLLQTRFIFNRIRCCLGDPYHLDLLHPSRRLWRLKLESCALTSLEQYVLDQYRCDDIPGAQIPAVYFKYLEDRDAREIVRVIDHNVTDILSMVSLLVKISSMVEEPTGKMVGGYEMLGLAGIFEAAGEPAREKECYEHCLNLGNAVIREKASKRLGSIYKRAGEYEKAVSQWQYMAEREGSLDIYPLVELAKYYEHKRKDYIKALSFTEQAMNRMLSVGIRSGRNIDDLKKRMERLKRKAEGKSWKDSMSMK